VLCVCVWCVCVCVCAEQLALSPSDPEGALRRSFAEVHQRMLTYFQKSNLREECGCTAIGTPTTPTPTLFSPRPCRVSCRVLVS
jgi:hypothetical protein